MKCDLNDILNMINGISNYGKYFLIISPQSGNLQSRRISKTKSTGHFIYLFIY